VPSRDFIFFFILKKFVLLSEGTNLFPLSKFFLEKIFSSKVFMGKNEKNCLPCNLLIFFKIKFFIFFPNQICLNLFL